ncbi:lysozyme [Ferrovum myxofaciens]|uniref:lysozyme n=1 Tax=Ferrovum myxofaciens TaxID=416213 RepID=UPI003EB790BD
MPIQIPYPEATLGRFGYGATGPQIMQGTIWTQEQADDDLTSRLEEIGAEIDGHVKVGLTDNQKAALADFAYNLGNSALFDSTLWALLNQGNFAGAAAQFGRWCHSCGRVVQGLVDRRTHERALFESV